MLITPQDAFRNHPPLDDRQIEFFNTTIKNNETTKWPLETGPVWILKQEKKNNQKL